MEVRRPDTIEEAVDLLAADPHGTKAISGGTALVLMLRAGLIAPDRLVAVDRLPGLAGISADDELITIGGTARIADVARHPAVRERTPALALAATQVGNVRIRNAGTMGGNVAEADYASDPPAVLVAMGAVAVLQGPAGVRRLPITDLITGFYSTALDPGELITAIEVPAPAGRRSSYEKYRSRSSEDRPCVGVAAAADIDDDGTVRSLAVVLGAAGPRPQQLPDVTAAAVGGPLDAAVVQEIAARYGADLEMMDDQRGSAWYRGRATQVAVRRALARLVDPGVVAA